MTWRSNSTWTFRIRTVLWTNELVLRHRVRAWLWSVLGVRIECARHLRQSRSHTQRHRIGREYELIIDAWFWSRMRVHRKAHKTCVSTTKNTPQAYEPHAIVRIHELLAHAISKIELRWVACGAYAFKEKPKNRNSWPTYGMEFGCRMRGGYNAPCVYSILYLCTYTDTCANRPPCYGIVFLCVLCISSQYWIWGETVA